MHQEVEAPETLRGGRGPLRLRALAPLLVALSGAGCVTTEVPYTRTDWLGSWDTIAAELEQRADEAPAPLKLLHAGRHLALQRVALAPASAALALEAGAAQLLLVVEGQGIAEWVEGRCPLESGSLLVLPPGASASVRAGAGAALQGLLVQAQALAPSAGDAPPRVLRFEEVIPPALAESREPTEGVPIVAIPGQLSVQALSIRATLPRHLHVEHDAILFFVQGWGSFGLGSLGVGRLFSSYPVRAKGLLYVPAAAPHGFENEAEQTLALVVFGPDLDPQRPDWHRTTDKKDAGQPEAARGD